MKITINIDADFASLYETDRFARLFSDCISVMESSHRRPVDYESIKENIYTLQQAFIKSESEDENE